MKNADSVVINCLICCQEQKLGKDVHVLCIQFRVFFLNLIMTCDLYSITEVPLVTFQQDPPAPKEKEIYYYMGVGGMREKWF